MSVWVGMAPCALCAAPVPRDTGCTHWRPQIAASKGHARLQPPLTSKERHARYRERKKAGLVGTVRSGPPKLSEADRAAREQERRVRDAGRATTAAALADLRRQMLIKEV